MDFTSQNVVANRMYPPYASTFPEVRTDLSFLWFYFRNMISPWHLHPFFLLSYYSIPLVDATTIVSDIVIDPGSNQILNFSISTIGSTSYLSQETIVGDYIGSKGQLHVNATGGLIQLDFRYIQRVVSNNNDDALDRARSYTKRLAQDALSVLEGILDTHVVAPIAAEHDKLRRLLLFKIEYPGDIALIVGTCILGGTAIFIEAVIL